MLKIWGRLNSINVQKVVWAAAELGLSFERIDAGMQFGIVRTPEYLAKNPNGLVPCVEDDGLVLWESNAIVRYFCAKHHDAYPAMWPSDVGRRALADRWMDWQSTTLTPAMGPAFMGLIRTPAEKRDAQAIANSAAQVEGLMPILDAHLSSHEFLGGPDFSMADIPCGAAVHRWLHLPLTRASWPNVNRWYRSIAARPAAGAALATPVT